ncbi:protein required for templated centriole assembly [Reticulomyxa filosa]|uniref:Protein required for templated centriole assembly n=1 Tax=Reticulomyxa filosa TaxID=46433 RepID=X6MFR3_RETFI|nr:protein required for templated centriole assembly [Reticulomyxa filosa]|eukprot:ETO12501.1 protein required for templated centriole assembly [Reticulomyxa filosa]
MEEPVFKKMYQSFLKNTTNIFSKRKGQKQNQIKTKDIEEITTKTGNYKTFETFSEMLYNALDETNKSVFIDLLTYQDLETLKTRKSLKTLSGSNSAGAL